MTFFPSVSVHRFKKQSVRVQELQARIAELEIEYPYASGEVLRAKALASINSRHNHLRDKITKGKRI